FYVSDCGCVGAATERVLVVVDDVELDSEPLTNGGDERGDGAVALTMHGQRFAVGDQLRGDGGALVVSGDELVRAQLEARLIRQVHGLELVPHRGRCDLGAGVFRDGLDRLGEFDLQAAGKREPVLVLHDVGDATLAGLTVHTDDRFVGPTDVRRINGQV